MPLGPPEIIIFKQVDVKRIARGGSGTFNIWLSTKSVGERDLVDARVVPFSTEHTVSVLVSRDH